MQPWIWIIGCGAFLLVVGTLRMVLGKRREMLPLPNWDIGASQTLGRQEAQQDAYSLSEQGAALLAVIADGKGSRNSDGRLLSQYAVEAFIRLFDEQSAQKPRYFFEQAARVANRRIAAALNGGSGGASVAACILKDRLLHYVSYGECCIGVYRNRELVVINEGDTYRALAQRKYRRAEISREMAIAAQRYDTVVQRLGSEEGIGALEQNEAPIPLRSGDRVALLTKGVVNGLQWQAIEALFERHTSPQAVADAVSEAVENSSLKHENASIVIIRVD